MKNGSFVSLYSRHACMILNVDELACQAHESRNLLISRISDSDGRILFSNVCMVMI